MDLFSKQKISAWAIGLLVLLNISMLYTLWSSKSPRAQLPGIEREQEPDPLVNELLKNELNLSDEQFELIVNLRKEHHHKARQISKESHNLKKELMDQLFEENDPIAADLLTNEIGENQAEFEREVFNYFKAIQVILNTEQNEKFKDLLQRVTTNRDSIPSNRPLLRGPLTRP